VKSCLLKLVSTHHLHPIVDHFTIPLLTFGIAAEILGAAAILLFWSRASVLSGWANVDLTVASDCGELIVDAPSVVKRRFPQCPELLCARRMDDVSTFAEVR
jgi:hypothetical protein